MHLGVAIALRGGGLVAPAIRDADRLALAELMARLRDLTARARGGRLRASEMTDATITVTNLGDQGVRAVFGVIYPPQVALVGFGKVTERVWADDGSMAVRPVVTATLSADHRATDGHIGARFLALVEQTPAPTGGAVTIDATAAVRRALAGIAPEADLDELAADADLQEELDLDSMDFLNFLIALGELTGVEVPESDYSQVRTFGACRAYVAARLGSTNG